MSGWIKLKREILDHWISQDNEYLAVWVRMLAEANFEPRKVALNGTLVEVGRGQLIFGLESYSAKTGVSIRRLRKLLDMLESDMMIDRQKTNKFSLISIVNYEKHQLDDRQESGKGQADDRQTSSKRQAKGNTIRSKELEEGKKDIKPLDFSTWPQMPDPAILKAWLEMRKRVKASTSQLSINTIGKEMFNAVAAGLTVNECLEIAELSGWKGFQTEWVLKARAKNAQQQTGFSPALNRGERLQKWAADTTERLEQELAELRSRESNGAGDFGHEEFIPYFPDVDS